MAAWQFDLEVVPRSDLTRRLQESDGQLDTRRRDESNWWEGASLPPGFVDRLQEFLPANRAWSPNWRLFGNEDGNRVDLLEDGDHLAEVRVRLDARMLNPEVVERLLKIIETSGCVLLTPEGKIVEPTFEAVWVELQLSPAAQFIDDPQQFLDWLRRRENS